MKKSRKVMSVLLIVAMLFTLAAPAMAAAGYSITVENLNETVSIQGNTYSAYKVFHATYDPNNDAISYTHDNTCLAVTYDGKSGQELIQWLGEVDASNNLVRTDAQLRAFADYVYENYIEGKAVTVAGSVTATSETATIAVPSAGYYLVFGTGNANSDTNGTDETITAAVSLTSAKPTATVNPKFDAPSLTKEIKHNDGDWGVVGDNQIGDTVDFRVEVPVPNVYGYENYVFKIHDTMSDGLTSNVQDDSDIKIKVNDSGDALSADYYDVDLPTANDTFCIDINLMKLISDGKVKTGDKLTVYYNAELNKDALIYHEGKQENKAYLEYSNNPYSDSTANTKEVVVYDWTFKMNIDKVNPDHEKLDGAVFVLSKNGKLDLGNINENGIPANTEGLIKLVKEADGVYRIATGTESDVTYTIQAGSATIEGLDDAVDYYLYETKAPDGYNKIDEPTSFKIYAKYNTAGDNLTAGYPSLESDGKNILLLDVINQSGATLPETGGIGTTIFYVVGGALVLAAAVLLVTRRRMAE